MHRNARMVLTSTLLFVATSGVAQPPPQQPAPPKTLAAAIGVYVFPGAGQPADRQSIDEASCYEWAVTNTGVEPFQAQKAALQAQAQAQAAASAPKTATPGSGVGGALVGAAAGALIGEIVDNDAGEGAGWGAAAGVIAGRRRSRQANAQAQQQAQQQAEAAQAYSAQQIDAFRKAFSACLEAKHYVAKF